MPLPTPSSTVGPSPAPLIGLLNPGRTRQRKANPRVLVLPSTQDTLLIVGVTIAGDWVAEFRCYVTDFDECCVTEMEDRVRLRERADIHAIP